MSEPWNQWYPHDIDTWQGSGNIQALSDTGYRAVHNIMQDMWKQDTCSLPCDQKILRKASRVADRWDKCKEEVLDYFDRTENGQVTNNVLYGKWIKAKQVYEARQNAAKNTNKTKPNHAPPSKASRSAEQSDPIAARSADTLTVTKTLTTTKKPQKPSRDASDQRHVPFRSAVESYMKYKSVEFTWDGGEAKQLAALLAASPTLTLETFRRCLFHRGNSVVTHGDRPREWLGTILKYQEGPLDQYGKPQGVGNGNQSKGDAAYDALRRSIEAGRNQNPSGEDGDSQTGEGGGTGVRGLLGGSDAVRDEVHRDGIEPVVLEASR